MIASASPNPKPAAMPSEVIAAGADVDERGDAGEAEEEEHERSERLRPETHAERLIHDGTSKGICPRLTDRTRVLASPSEVERAGDRARTGDIQLGRLALYQLSYTRVRLA